MHYRFSGVWTLALLSGLAGCGSPPPHESTPTMAGGSGAPTMAGAAGSGGVAGGAEAGASAAGIGGSATDAGGGGSAATSAGQSNGGHGGSGGAPVAGSAGQGPGGSTAGPATHDELVLYDDDGKLWYVNNVDPKKGWSVSSGTGRDLQLVGNDRVMLGKSNGWVEHRLSDGMQVGSRTNFSGVQSVHRLADGSTMLASVSGNSIVLRFVSDAGDVAKTITYDGYGYVRLVRPTSAGTFLVTADTLVFEGDGSGKVLKTWTIPGKAQHVWKSMRFKNANTAVATGYGASLLIYGPDQQLLQTIGGKLPALSAVDPHFFADFHVRPNGNYFVVNSQADSSNPNSVQLLEFSPTGELVWQQKQPAGVRSLEAAIVLDGLDTSKLQIEPDGVLVSAP